MEARARAEVEDDHVAFAQALAAGRDELARAQEGRDFNVAVVARRVAALRLPLGLALFALALALLLVLRRFALGLLEFFGGALLLFGGAFERERRAVLGDELLHPAVVCNGVDLVDLHGLLLHLASVVQLALRDLLRERVVVDALVVLVLVLRQLAQERGDVERGIRRRLEDGVGKVRVVARTLERDRQSALALALYLDAVPFELQRTPHLRAPVGEAHAHVACVVRHLQKHFARRAEPVAQSRARARRELDRVGRLAADRIARDGARENLLLLVVGEPTGFQHRLQACREGLAVCERPKMAVARARPGGARVGRRVALAIREDEVRAQRARRLHLRSSRARVRAVTAHRPLVGRVAQRCESLLAADGLDVVADDFVRRRQLRRLRARWRGRIRADEQEQRDGFQPRARSVCRGGQCEAAR